MADSPAAPVIMRARMEEMRAASLALRAVLEDLEVTAGGIIELLDEGKPLAEMYRSVGFDEVRDRVFAASSAFDTSFQNARAAGVRMLVEDGMTFSQIARLMGRSRQFVSRLYRAAGDVD